MCNYIKTCCAQPKAGPPREARQPRLGPWLDFENWKTTAAVASHPCLPKSYRDGPE